MAETKQSADRGVPGTLCRLDHRDERAARSIHRLLRSAYAVEAALIGAARFPPLERSVNDIRTSACEFIGCEVDGELAGVLELQRDPGGDAWATIASLGVEPACARRGIGRALVERALAETGGLVRVSTARGNAPAVALYRALGFRAAGHAVTPEGIRLVRMERPPR